MEFINNYKAMIRETFELRSFKRMNVVMAVFCGITAIPLMLIYAIVTLIYGALLILHLFLDTPADYIFRFLKREGKDVQNGTQAIMYLIGFPLVFILKFATGLLTFVLFIFHMLSTLLGFLATFGGVTISPFILYPSSRTEPRETKKYGKGGMIAYMVIAYVLIVATLVCVSLTAVRAINVSKMDSPFVATITDVEKALEKAEDEYTDEQMALYEDVKDELEEYIKDEDEITASKKKLNKVDKAVTGYMKELLPEEKDTFATIYNSNKSDYDKETNTLTMFIIIDAVIIAVYWGFFIGYVIAFFRCKKVAVAAETAEAGGAVEAAPAVESLPEVETADVEDYSVEI